ncbi:MAG: hypothetical protein U5R06_17195 [candidate division KSB1 bacterium]|nr:hypothetical protein [candidate division KSB1 bacterium]
MNHSTGTLDSKSGLIQEWLVIGPFDGGEPATLLETPFIDKESEVVPDEGQVYQKHQWSRKTVDSQGKVDFMEIGITREYVGIYAHVYVHSQAMMSAFILVGSTDAYAVWVNGCSLKTADIRRPWSAGQDRIRIRLGRGWNRLLFKIVNHAGGYAFSGRITDMQDQGMPGLRYSVSKPGEDMNTLQIDAWMTCTDVKLQDVRYADKNIKLSLSPELANLTPISVEDATITLSALDADGVVIIQKQIPRSLSVIDLQSSEIIKMIKLVDRLQAEIQWAQNRDSAVFEFQPVHLLNAILSTKDIRIPAALQKIQATILENLQWIRIFAPERIQVTRDVVADLVQSYADQGWQAARAQLNEWSRIVSDMTTDLKTNTIFFTGNAHIDMAWLWRYEETIQVCYETFESALGFMDEYPGFVFCQSSAQVYWWMEQRFPQLFEKIRARVKAGQWAITAAVPLVKTLIIFSKWIKLTPFRACK